MRKLYLIVILFLVNITTHAQVNSPTARRIVGTTVSPTTCLYSVNAPSVVIYNGDLYLGGVGNTCLKVASGGGAGSVASVGLTGTASQIIVTGTSPITTSGSWALSLSPTIALGTDNSIAGTLTLANSAAAAHTTFGSVATTSNTFNFPATVPTAGHLLDCTTTSTTCVIHDSGVTTASVLSSTGYSSGSPLAKFNASSVQLTPAVAADVIALFSGCSGTLALSADGACHAGGAAATAVVRHPLYCRNPQSSTNQGNTYPNVTALSNGLDWQHWEFINGVTGTIYCSIKIPHNVDATPAATLIAHYAATTTATANVRLQEGDFIVGATSSYNQSFTTTTAQTVAIGAIWTNFNVTFTPNATIAADSELWVELIRIGGDAADTYALPLALDGIDLQITEDF